MNKNTIKSLMAKYGYSEKMAVEALEFASEIMWEYLEEMQKEYPNATKSHDKVKNGYYELQEITDFVESV